MKLSSVLKIVALSSVLSGSAHALEWRDRDPNSGSYLDYLEAGDSYVSDFNLTFDGFDPATMYVTSATAYFDFSDGQYEDSAWEIVDIFLGGYALILNQEVDGTHSGGYARYSASLTNDMIAALQDGIISYEVQLQNLDDNRDNTYLKVAKLKAYGTDRPPVSVPDSGATSILVGLALAGLVALRRRFHRAA